MINFISMNLYLVWSPDAKSLFLILIEALIRIVCSVRWHKQNGLVLINLILHVDIGSVKSLFLSGRYSN